MNSTHSPLRNMRTMPPPYLGEEAMAKATVRERLTTLTERLRALGQSINELDSRLSPICSAPSPVGADMEDPNGDCDMCTEVHGLTLLVIAMQARLSDMHQRLLL
jgi:hypothetical protein